MALSSRRLAFAGLPLIVFLLGLSAESSDAVPAGGRRGLLQRYRQYQQPRYQGGAAYRGRDDQDQDQQQTYAYGQAQRYTDTYASGRQNSYYYGGQQQPQQDYNQQAGPSSSQNPSTGNTVSVPSTGNIVSDPSSGNSVSGPSSGSSVSGSDILGLHNQYRSVHHTAPLSWSSALESSAQSFANQLASSCSFHHSQTNGVGENLAAGHNSWAEVAADWYNEIRQYNYASTGFTEGTGHATQMLWKGSTQLGCATAAAPSGCWQRVVYVCQYSPPGNVMGQFTQNVMAP